MHDESALPVFVNVTREDGRQEQVQVGYAIRAPSGFVLQLGAMTIGSAATTQSAAPVRPLHASTNSSPPQLSCGASIEELEGMAERARKTLANPKRARWHADELQLLQAIEAELERKRTSAPVSSVA